jgi:hypothetical protein
MCHKPIQSGYDRFFVQEVYMFYEKNNTTVDNVFELEPLKAAGVRKYMALELEGAAGTMPKIK